MVQIIMSGFAGGLSPMLLTSFLLPVISSPIPVDWVSVWFLSGGILGMGLRDIMGGGDDEAPADPPADEDFLDGDIGGPGADGYGGFDDGLDVDDDPLADVEPRLDDFEAELADLASTVSSVRGEHESMRESVEGIEENIRKLLEVYEVVTQGVNPFVDDSRQAAPSGGAFGLLDGGDETPSSEGLEDENEGDTPEESAAPVEESSGQSAEEGLSFDDLKSGFEFVDEAAQTGDDDGHEVKSAAEPIDPDPQGTAGSETLQSSDAAAHNDGGRRSKPYLSALPEGYGAELLVMEWLHFLVTESSLADAINAVRYYRTVDWISEEVASHLQTVLSGANPARERATPDGGVPSELSVDHHTQSLEYISRLGSLTDGRERSPAAGRVPRDRRGWEEDGGV